MKNLPDHAESWVIHDNQALLFRQRDGLAVEELRMPFQAFLGSATALASFSLPDTRVYLNVGPAEKHDNTFATSCWAGVARDPSRLLIVNLQEWHQQALTALSSMGKKAVIVSTADPTRFQESAEMAKLSPRELKHLAAGIRLDKSGAGKYRSLVYMAWRLWLSPDPGYQQLRWAAAIGMLISALVMQGIDRQPASAPKESISSQPADPGQGVKSIPVQFSDWATQVRKFGQDNKANLKSLQISWTEQGQVFTQVEMEKERKRVPKGCKLIDSRQATCTTSGMTP